LTIPQRQPIPNGQQQRKAPRIKIEFTDTSGAKYSLSVEGGMSKESMTKMIDFANQMSSPQQTELQNQNPEPDYSNIDTNFSRVYGLLETKFKFGSFTSSDVLEAYEQEYDAQTTLSTISTYLSRLTQRGLVNRTRNGLGWTYKLVRSEFPEQNIPQTTTTDSLSPNLLTE
jgi:Penicillinase repressor